MVDHDEAVSVINKEINAATDCLHAHRRMYRPFPQPGRISEAPADEGMKTVRDGDEIIRIDLRSTPPGQHVSSHLASRLRVDAWVVTGKKSMEGLSERLKVGIANKRDPWSHADGLHYRDDAVGRSRTGPEPQRRVRSALKQWSDKLTGRGGR